MSIEIERKFLVNTGDYKNLATPEYYQQGYLTDNNKSVVRIRIAGDRGFITVKEKSTELSRLEFEYEIPLDDARKLLDQICEQPTISKHRYKIKYKGLIWEVDEFHEANEGLVIAEVELISENQEFETPPWIGKEVTGNSNYYNVNLARKPFNEW